MSDYSLAVIIPCWNCEAYIGEMIECLSSQTFSDWKAFLVDDGCTDGSADIIKEHSLKDERINYVLRDREPKGAQTCRNIGFQLSEGAKYVVFFDADDLVAPHCFEQRIGFMRAHSSVDFSSFPTKAFKTHIFDDTYWGFGVPGKQNLILSLLYWKTLQIFVSSNIYKRDSLINAGVQWDERLLCMQDADFNIQSITKGLNHKFADSARIDYFYRTGHSSISKRIAEPSMFKSHLYLMEKVLSSFQNAFKSRYDFFLRTYIVNFFDLFRKDKRPYLSLLRFRFVRSCPVFYLKIILFLMIGLRGKNILFKKYTCYSIDSAKQWSSVVSDSIQRKIAFEITNG